MIQRFYSKPAYSLEGLQNIIKDKSNVVLKKKKSERPMNFTIPDAKPQSSVYSFVNSPTRYSYHDHLNLLDADKSISKDLFEKFNSNQSLQSMDRREYIFSLLDSLNQNSQFSLKDKISMLNFACDYFITGDSKQQLDLSVAALKGTQQEKSNRI